MTARLPVITLMPPEHCADCKKAWDADDKAERFTLFGTPEHCVWLCNSCFRKQHAMELKALERRKLVDVKIRPNGD